MITDWKVMDLRRCQVGKGFKRSIPNVSCVTRTFVEESNLYGHVERGGRRAVTRQLKLSAQLPGDKNPGILKHFNLTTTLE